MALSIKYLSSYPQFGFNGTPTSVDGSSFTFTNGVDSTSYTGYVAGYVDGEGRATLFKTDGVAVALPKLVEVKQVSIVDAAGTTKTGGYYIILGSWSSLSPDASSINSEIYVDQMGLIIAASTAYG